MIDRLAGADTHKIELFGRTSKLRNGWLILGRQIPSAEKSSVAMEAEVVKNADEKI